MRGLLLLRHGAAAAKAAAGDRERALTSEGRRAVQALAGRLRSRGIQPDLVLCSPARRTRETLELLEAAWATRPEATIEEPLYLADAASLLLRLRAAEPEAGGVLLVGHNPGLEELARTLAGPGNQSLRAGLPTAGLVVFDISAPWSGLAPASARLVEVLAPEV
jgi:phosphohistidine phosphatase